MKRFFLAFLCACSGGVVEETHYEFYVNQALTPEVEAMMPANGAKKAMIVYQHHIDGDNNGIFDGIRVLEDALVSVYNFSVDYDGPAALDWEGVAADAMYAHPVGSPSFNNAMEQFIIAIKAAKELRPKAKWGYYGMPFATYWSVGPAWEARLDALKPLHDEMDVFFPSFYHAYNEADGVPQAQDIEWIHYNTKQSLLRANKKPVLGYIGTRYMVCCSDHMGVLLPDNQLVIETKALFDIEIDGDKVDGVVWWGADQYNYGIAIWDIGPDHPYWQDKQNAMAVFIPELEKAGLKFPLENPNEYWTMLHGHQMQVIRESLKK